MVIIGVIVYLSLVCLGLALWLLPAWRARAAAAVLRGTTGWLGRWPSARKAAGGAMAGRAMAAWSASRAGLRAAGNWRWGVAAMTLAAVPLTAAILRHAHIYDGFDHTVARSSNPQIAALLQGEQLSPPPRLPPELFTTREVETSHPLAASASRQWELLDPEFSQRLLLVFKLMRERHGYDMVLIEGWRSPERQAQLVSMGPHVTHAGPGQSWHQVGLAADCAFLRDGRIVISERDPWAARGYQLYGELAQSVGLTWGGSWRTIVDLGHVELRRAGALQARSPG